MTAMCWVEWEGGCGGIRVEHTKIENQLPDDVQRDCHCTFLMHSDEHGSKRNKERRKGQESIFL